MTTRLSLLLSLLLLVATSRSFAGYDQCKKTVDDAIKQCQEAATTAAKNSNDTAAAGAATVAGSGQSGLGGTGAQANTASGAGFTAANAECAKQKDRCEQDCKPASESNKEKKAKIPDEKKRCDEKIDDISKQLTGAAGTNKDAAGKSEDTKDKAAGQGGMPQMPQMPKDDKKDDKSDTPASTGSTAAAVTSTGSAPAALANALQPAGGTSADCASDEAYLAESCKDKLKAQCASDASTGVCQAFTARFCGTSGGSAASSGGTLSNGDQLKVGAGLSDDYCRGNNAKMFCTSGSVDQCSSCRALRGLSPLPSNQISQDCSLDPAGLPTPTANAVVPQSSSSAASGGYGTGGGGGSGLSSGSSTAAKLDQGATPDDPNAKLASGMSLGVGGGGGGGGGGGDSGGGSRADSNSVSDFLSGYNVIGRSPSSAKAAADASTLNPKITDVAPFGAPPLMQIQSLVIKARCDADKALNCPPHH